MGLEEAVGHFCYVHAILGLMQSRSRCAWSLIWGNRPILHPGLLKVSRMVTGTPFQNVSLMSSSEI